MPRPFPHVEGVEHRFVEVDGLRVHVAEAGGGEPLVMLHGWPQHWYLWRHVVPLLADRFRLICPDMRGFGWTDAPAHGYEKEQLAGDVLGLLDALELDRVRLVGHDWGGWVGFLACLRAPERFERFLALNIAHPFQRFDARVAHAWRFWYQLVIAAPALGAWVLRERPEFVRLIFRLGAADRATFSDAELAAFVESIQEPARARASSALYRTFLTREFPAVARGRYESSRLSVPTLLLFGARDFAIAPSWLRGYEPHTDEMTLEVVPDCGHFIADERPELVAERALELFA